MGDGLNHIQQLTSHDYNIQMVDKNKGRLFAPYPKGMSDSRSQGSLQGRRREAEGRESHEDALQLKIQLLLSRLTKQRPSRDPPAKFSPALSKSKTSKLTFGKPEPLPLSEQLRELKERTQTHFQFQFEILKEEYVALNHAHGDYLAEKDARSVEVKEGMKEISGMLERVKETALSLSLSRKHLKAYSQMVRGQPGKKPPPETPFRLSLTPFQRDNSLLISVKRSLEGFASYSTAKKPDRDGHNPDESYKYSENLNFPEHPPQQREQESSYKNFIKETEEQDVGLQASFDVLERSLMQKLHEGSGDCQKRLERSRTRVSSFAAEVDQLKGEIAEERRNCTQEWRGIEAAVKKELAEICDAISEGRKNVLAMDHEREAVFLLMEESVEEALIQQRRTYRQDHGSIIQNLHEVISIFQ